MCNVISFQHYMCFHVDIQILIIGHIACCFHFVMYTYDVFSNNIAFFLFFQNCSQYSFVFLYINARGHLGLKGGVCCSKCIYHLSYS